MSIERTKEQIAVMQAYCEGKQIEIRNGDGIWVSGEHPLWIWGHADYRVAVTKPVVPWSVLADWVQFVGRNSDGDFYAFKKRPEPKEKYWKSYELSCFLAALKIDPGTCDWRDSLVERPKGGDA